MALMTTTMGSHRQGSDLFAGLRSRLSDYRAYRRTIVEMNLLSNSDLADLGLARQDVAAVARAAIYGR